MPPRDPVLSSPTSLAAARASGLSLSQWRRPHLVRVTQEVRSPVAPADLTERCRAFALALPDDVVFSHLTAAGLLGLPLPRWAASGDLLDVMRESSRPPVERGGCRGHRGLERRRVTHVAGLPVTGPVDTWVDLAEICSPQTLSVDDLVVVADAVLMALAERIVVQPGEEEWEAVLRHQMAADAGGGSRTDRRDDFVEAMSRRTRPRGARRLRDALHLARVGVRSPMETLTRLLVVRSGLPEPELNAAVVGDAGWILEGDLVWREQRVIGEYQGDHHGGRRQRSVDVARRNLAEDDGWRVVEIWAEDLFQRSRRIALLRRLAHLLGVDPHRLDLG
ncbi:hypothetical protein LL946_13445 [Knoellia locipacati]|uniref:hypothetical protein n=1 Tax=Knoellia locipacati TaxID=882824 RepID=UPI00384F59A7